MKSVIDTVGNMLFAAACAVVVMIGAIQLYDRFAQPGSSTAVRPSVERVNNLVIDITGAAVRSSGIPRAAIVEFADFQCSYCARFAQTTYREIQRNFVDNGVAAFAFINYPLERVHPLAFQAGEAAECARRQDRFWDMHDALFADQGGQTPFLETARTLHLRMPDFEDCLARDSKATIRSHLELAEGADIKSTPTFLVGRMLSPGRVQVVLRLIGAQPYTAFATAVRDALSSQT